MNTVKPTDKIILLVILVFIGIMTVLTLNKKRTDRSRQN